jgi:hypothetical protein
MELSLAPHMSSSCVILSVLNTKATKTKKARKKETNKIKANKKIKKKQ